MISLALTRRVERLVATALKNNKLDSDEDVYVFVRRVLLHEGGLRAALYTLTLADVHEVLEVAYFEELDFGGSDELGCINDSLKSLSEHERHVLACDFLDLAAKLEKDEDASDSVAVSLSLAWEAFPPISNDLRKREEMRAYYRTFMYLVDRVKESFFGYGNDDLSEVDCTALSIMGKHLLELWQRSSP